MSAKQPSALPPAPAAIDRAEVAGKLAELWQTVKPRESQTLGNGATVNHYSRAGLARRSQIETLACALGVEREFRGILTGDARREVAL